MKVNPTIIVAEAGVNHDGHLNQAIELIEIAADSGADLVKFQTFCADRLVLPGTKKAEYQSVNSSSDESQYEMLSRLELSRVDHEILIKHCEKLGIGFFSTGFDTVSLDMLFELGQSLFKIPSGEITNLPYLRHVGSFGKPVVMSTGMASLSEVGAALDVLEKSGTPREIITVLHCTSEYPANITTVNLRALSTIRESFNVNVGYSDHTLGIEVAIAAVSLGASLIEKHVTLDRTLEGPDHAASLEPHELKSMISAIRNIESAFGDGVKSPTHHEVINARVVRKSIVTACPIRAGEPFTTKNLTTKRPGSGVSPMLLDKILGTLATRDYQENEMIIL